VRQVTRIEQPPRSDQTRLATLLESLSGRAVEVRRGQIFPNRSRDARLFGRQVPSELLNRR